MPRQFVSDERRAQDRQATRRSLIYAGLGLLALVLVAVIVWFHQLTAAPPPPAIANASDAGAATPAAVPLDAQVQAAQQAVVTGPGQPVVMEITAQDVTQRLAEPLRKAGVSGAKVYLADGKVAVQGVVSRKGRKLHVTIGATPVVTEGTIQVKVTDARIGRARMPARLREELQRGVDKAIRENPPAKTGVAWSDVQVLNGRVVLQGTTVAYNH
jgi:hypothetical protein